MFVIQVSSSRLPSKKLNYKHFTMLNAYGCCNIKSRDILKFYGTFYFNKTKINQDNLILNMNQIIYLTAIL